MRPAVRERLRLRKALSPAAVFMYQGCVWRLAIDLFIEV